MADARRFQIEILLLVKCILAWAPTDVLRKLPAAKLDLRSILLRQAVQMSDDKKKCWLPHEQLAPQNAVYWQSVLDQRVPDMEHVASKLIHTYDFPHSVHTESKREANAASVIAGSILDLLIDRGRRDDLPELISICTRAHKGQLTACLQGHIWPIMDTENKSLVFAGDLSSFRDSVLLSIRIALSLFATKDMAFSKEQARAIGLSAMQAAACFQGKASFFCLQTTGTRCACLRACINLV